jgi:preprotein translocase subunit SecD
MLKLFMNKNGNATALLMFVVVSLVLIFLVPAPERFEEEPQPGEAQAPAATDPAADPATAEPAAGESAVEPEAVAAATPVENIPPPEAETNLAPANPALLKQPSALQGTPAAAPVVTPPADPVTPAEPMQAQAPVVIQPNQRRIVGGVPVQENLSMVPISTNQPAPIVAEMEDGRKVVLMIPASIKNA